MPSVAKRTLEEFYQHLQPFADPFMALFERDHLPSRSALSRFFAALAVAVMETFQRPHGSISDGVYQKLVSQLVFFHVRLSRSRTFLSSQFSLGRSIAHATMAGSFNAF